MNCVMKFLENLLENQLEVNEMKQARKRMANICADPDEVYQYKWNPNGARNNRHPGIPIEDYGDYGDQRGGPGIDYTD